MQAAALESGLSGTGRLHDLFTSIEPRANAKTAVQTCR